MGKGRIAAIIVSSLAIVCLAAFFIYWAFASVQINRFLTLDFDSIKTGGSYIKIRGADIHYIEAGKGNNHVLLVHGFGGGAFTFKNNIDFLAESGFKVYAIDLKGFGYSERIKNSDHSHIEQAKIILEFIDKKGIEKVSAAGHSMGGRVILIAYDIDPGKFEKIILIDSAGLEQNRSRFFSRILSQPIVDIIYYNLFLDRDSFTAFLSTAFYRKEYLSDSVIYAYLEPYRIKGSNKAYASIIKGNVDYNIESVLQKINIPALVIWGAEDTWIDLSQAYRFSSLLKNSKLEIIENAGHLPMEEKPDIFNIKVLEFLK